VTLDDVSCLLHLPINGMLLSHEAMTQNNAVEWMVEHMGIDPGQALVEVTRTKGAHCPFSYLRRIFKERMLEQLALETKHGVVRRCGGCGTRLSAYICYTLWGSRSSLTRAPLLWMLSTSGTLEALILLLIIHGELRH
jgi:hypothetical protein